MLPITYTTRELGLVLKTLTSFLKNYKMNKGIFRTVMVVCVLTFSVHLLAQNKMNDNGTIRYLYYDEEKPYYDLFVPENTEKNSITFSVKGGDGGVSKVVACKANGGEGATVNFSILIGNEEGKIPPGSLLRVIVGAAGTSESASVPLNHKSGGGGGGSAILIDTGSGWKILAVAGGGGGGYIGNIASICVSKRNGQGGRSTINGGNGRGDLAGSGGNNGHGGQGGGVIDDGDLSGGGGGYLSNGGGASCYEGEKGGIEGGKGGATYCFLTNVSPREGGFGFGGGGAGDEGGGGGGGYSGGGGGGLEGSGGGGGSYLNDNYTVFDNEIIEGETVSTAYNGAISYQFAEICEASLTGFQYINALCGDNARGRIQLLPILDQANQCTANLDYRLLPENGHIYMGDGIFRAVKKGTYTAQIVNTELDVVVSEIEIEVEVNEEAPVARCKPVTVTLQNGSYSNNKFWQLIDDGSSSPCDDPLNYSVNLSSFDCSHIGDNNIKMTVIGSNGVSNECTTTVTVKLSDADQPIARCVDDFTVNIDQRDIPVTVDMINNNSFLGTCAEELDISVSPTGLFCTDLGEKEITLTISDGFENTSTCTTTINLVDESLPVAKCKAASDIPPLILDKNNRAVLPFDYIDNGSSDNCFIQIGLSQKVFDCSDVGDNQIILTVSDNAGRATSCTTSVRVVDQTLPEILCNNLTVSLDENGQYNLDPTLLISGTDNCGEISFTASQTIFTCQDVGTQRLTMTATDGSNNSVFCFANLTVVDDTPPVVVCKSEVITKEIRQSEGFVRLYTNELIESASDVCGVGSILQFTFDNGSFLKTLFCSEVGQHNLTVTGVDVNGNKGTCEATIEVIDNTVPQAYCQNITVELNKEGSTTVTAQQIDDFSGDNCDEITLSIISGKTTFDCGDVGQYSLTLEALNAAGQGSTCEATVTVVNDNAPTARCRSLTIQLDDTGNHTIATEDIDNGSYSSCGEFNLQLDKTSFDCSNIGSNTVTLTLTDDQGNKDECIGKVTVVGNYTPHAFCKNFTVQLDANGKGSITPQDIDSQSFTSCGEFSLELDVTDFDCSNIGENRVFLSVIDEQNNISTCGAHVIVEDKVAPTANCKDVTVQLDDQGTGQISSSEVNNGSSDACGIKSMSLDKTIISCADKSVTLTVIDNNDNENTCVANLILEDNTAPVPDQSSLSTVKGECTATVSTSPTAMDNCTSQTIIGTTNDPLTYNTQGIHTITWTFDDGNGNTFTQTQTVIIDDVTAPVPDVATLPTITGNCEVGLEPPFATDNCEGQILGSTSDPLYFDEEGTYTVTWIYDDGNGNTSSQDQTIVIEDDVAPVPDRQTLPTIRRQCSATVTAIPTATDRCGGIIQGTTSDPLTYNTQGIHIITWIYDDGNGNAVTQTQRVVIRDNKAPVPDQANLPALTGSCSVMITNFPTATDNCAGSITATTDSPLEFDQEGTYAILWTYDDGNGNTNLQTQWVIVGGDVAPNALCKNISMPMAGNGSVNISASDIDNGSFDDCSQVTLLISPVGGSIFGTGLPPASNMDIHCVNGKEQNLLLSVTNGKGNTAYCQAKVTLQGTDTDNDGILDSCDNCPDTYNLNQKDSNNNGTGDACEESSNPDPNPGGWGGWSLKKQGKEELNIITELKAFPNPFKEDLNLSFNLSQEEKTTVEIFNIQGQRVHTLLSEIAPKGEHRVLWDGKDQNGQPLPSGIYLIRLRAGKALINQKVVLQR